MNKAYYQSLRYFFDRLVTVIVTGGGYLVIFFVTLIFAFLLISVLPLFSSAKVAKQSEYYQNDVTDNISLLEMEEGAEMVAHYRQSGEWLFSSVADGEILHRLYLPDEWLQSQATAIAASHDSRYLVYGSNDGQVLIAEREWQITYNPAGEKVITPKITFPFTDTAIVIDPQQRALEKLAIATDDEGITVVAMVAAQTVAGEQRMSELLVQHYSMDNSSWTDEQQLALEAELRFLSPQSTAFLRLDPARQYIYAVNRQGEARQYSIGIRKEPRLQRTYDLVNGAAGVEVNDIQFLLGGYSLLVGDTEGRIVQWGLVQSENSNTSDLQKIREFSIQGAVRLLRREHQRKSFYAVSDDGYLAVYHSTSGKRLFHQQLFTNQMVAMVVSPRAEKLLVDTDNGERQVFAIENEHPEISWGTLWRKVWYEGYEEPEYIWQSSSSSKDFEPKFSLVPISLGTLKATFYAVLFAIPLALGGAIYTAFFMSPGMRRLVKPTIEIMEALPTVILGFLAGLWFAPFAEKYLLGILLLIPILPIASLLVAAGQQYLPASWQRILDKGWQGLVLIPVMILIAWGTIYLGLKLELLLFDQGFISYLNTRWDVGFSQRNAIIIGIAMGFAVIPTIFSITEDAVYSVPPYLLHGSLALGATQWQSLVRVVILTASPGIFAAIMIGLGRVVGETMIVLMATGNTPVLDFNIFHGMRTLSANIAVELPEAEVASTHARVLYLSALLLFLFTFVVNTAGEMVRQRLRRNYSRL